ncbi:hypothetical protein BVC80_8847g20 [Macleaya cordata]|uniref:F-box associated beta-propeller type 1 domain-containing protein n=1 Tax=Macleaya cordata TaxID=56857 RepID=A0A200PZX7_MACCD|nr:hypothetical protein BVC80_8847g20 [Macleaya cordata]
MVLIFLSKSIQQRTSLNENIFRVNEHVQSDQEPFSIFQRSILEREQKFYMQFMEIIDGKSMVKSLNLCCLGQIRASCNGLVLLENKLKCGGSLVINPVSRKLVPLPPGTISTPRDESFGFGFCSNSEEYKVVHLFRNENGYVECEIINVGSRSWRPTDRPSDGIFSWFGTVPVFAIGALNWIPHSDSSEYIVSMGVDDERFCKIPLRYHRNGRISIVF